MSRASGVLSRGRRAAESLMTDTCTVTRAGTGKGSFNETTGKYDDQPARVVVYSGPCRLQVRNASESDVIAGERDATVQTFELQLPIEGTETVSVNDVAEITAANHDPALVGRLFTIAARHEKSHATARRLPVITGTA